MLLDEDAKSKPENHKPTAPISEGIVLPRQSTHLQHQVAEISITALIDCLDCFEACLDCCHSLLATC
jgi:hypothetical protein